MVDELSARALWITSDRSWSWNTLRATRAEGRLDPLTMPFTLMTGATNDSFHISAGDRYDAARSSPGRVAGESRPGPRLETRP